MLETIIILVTLILTILPFLSLIVPNTASLLLPKCMKKNKSRLSLFFKFLLILFVYSFIIGIASAIADPNFLAKTADKSQSVRKEENTPEPVKKEIAPIIETTPENTIINNTKEETSISANSVIPNEKEQAVPTEQELIKENTSSSQNDYVIVIEDKEESTKSSGSGAGTAGLIIIIILIIFAIKINTSENNSASSEDESKKTPKKLSKKELLAKQQQEELQAFEEKKAYFTEKPKPMEGNPEDVPSYVLGLLLLRSDLSILLAFSCDAPERILCNEKIKEGFFTRSLIRDFILINETIAIILKSKKYDTILSRFDVLKHTYYLLGNEFSEKKDKKTVANCLVLLDLIEPQIQTAAYCMHLLVLIDKINSLKTMKSKQKYFLEFQDFFYKIKEINYLPETEINALQEFINLAKNSQENINKSKVINVN